VLHELGVPERGEVVRAQPLDVGRAQLVVRGEEREVVLELLAAARGGRGEKAGAAW
jgi:hypothetical protein